MVTLATFCASRRLQKYFTKTAVLPDDRFAEYAVLTKLHTFTVLTNLTTKSGKSTPTTKTNLHKLTK